MSQTRAQLVKGLSNTSGSDDTITVASNGRVGINKSSPNQILHVEDSGSNVYVRVTETGNTGIDFGQATDGNGVINLRDNADIQILTNGVEELRVLAAGGLTFNGDTAAANALDDYEEGDHTCAVTAGTSGTITLSASTLSYVKIGNLVSVQGRLDVSSVSSPTGELELSMPFANASGLKNHSTPAIFIWQANSSQAPNNGLWVGFMGDNTSTLNLRYGDSHTPPADGAAAMQANTEIRIMLTYRTV